MILSDFLPLVYQGRVCKYAAGPCFEDRANSCFLFLPQVGFAFLACFVAVQSQHHGYHYADHGGHDYLDSSHATNKHGHHGALDEYGDSGYAKHGHHELDAHKAHAAKESHHDLHKAHHDKGYYERKKGHGFVKVLYCIYSIA
ncbi:hypothetical protein AVEN_215345-1 [Araneus ventricosus]|uniref:Uncharacterized protein n=1 Tax=Araneus ventricosus TaxID=182803 RepID=A0A4Y2GDM6_ARAVE|nr:hypothetical protein AVEN_215345-1 [Araneus ventricosus]